jgi:hypothetical protein
MEETLTYVALQGWYDIESAKVVNLLSPANNPRNNCRAHLLHLQHCQNEPVICFVSPQVHDLREMHVRGVFSSIKLTSLGNASEDFGIPNFGQLFRTPIEAYWRHEVSGLVLGYDQKALLDSICIKLQTGLL